MRFDIGCLYDIKILQVEAKNHTRALQDWIDTYEKFDLQESDQTLNRTSESVEFNKVKELPKVRKKKVKKNKKKLGKKKIEKKKVERKKVEKKKVEKDKRLLVKKKRFPKIKKKNTKRKRNKNVKKFVKTLSDRSTSNDSNMSASNVINVDDTPVDIIVHIKMSD
ncbi:unnamed protein product [Parnassius apollo]|uniref:(apollo) hypothetical protein n=1 Tax=Parnassius apollo TaxID=110799 RepID=A0A8S3WLC8_PARAO|nr:unnamed protein product [Parnassius apollo]